MLDAHAHVMQVKLCKANTRGVTDRILGDRNQEKSFQPPESYGYMPPRKPIVTKGNRRPTRTRRGLQKEGQGPQNPPIWKNPLKEYSTPPQARGLLPGTNARVPEEEELMTINIDSSE